MVFVKPVRPVAGTVTSCAARAVLDRALDPGFPAARSGQAEAQLSETAIGLSMVSEGDRPHNPTLLYKLQLRDRSMVRLVTVGLVAGRPTKQ